MPVAVRLVEFLTIVALFFLMSTGAFLLYFADKIIYFLGFMLTPVMELLQLTVVVMEYFFYWSTKNLLHLLTILASCCGAGPSVPSEG